MSPVASACSLCSDILIISSLRSASDAAVLPTYAARATMTTIDSVNKIKSRFIKVWLLLGYRCRDWIAEIFESGVVPLRTKHISEQPRFIVNSATDILPRRSAAIANLAVPRICAEFEEPESSSFQSHLAARRPTFSSHLIKVVVKNWFRHALQLPRSGRITKACPLLE